jgi:HK97 gp10 family phage protein
LPNDFINININGLDKIKDKMQKAMKIDEIRQAMIQGGLMIEGDAKRLSPFDTGRLRSSISTNWDDSSMSRASVQSPAKNDDGVSQPTKETGDICVVRIGTNVEYAMYQEYGTRYMPPHSFLHPAVAMGIMKIKNQIRSIISKQ